ncbi:MAG: cytochrome P450 [Myxococcales bacterium]|nr:cytochrome P450 [Myxococcales bacterium]HQY63963.1 cytochrome P450 [Polyangiaceae bacterium]
MSIDELPVVPGGNVLGHVHLFQDDRLRFLRTVGETGPLSRLRFLHRWVVMASAPETAHAVLVEHAKSFEKSPGIRVLLHELAGDGLFTSEGDLWKKQRRLMSPLFHAQPLAGYAPTMSDVARRALAEVADGERVDLSRLTTRIAMGVVAATLFGAESAGDADDIGHALTVALKWVDGQMASSYLTLQITLIELLEKLQPVVPAPLASVQAKLEEALRDPILLPGRRDPELVAAVQRLDTYVQALIDDRRASPQARVDLLTKLLLVRDVEGGRTEGMSDKQVRDEANTLFVAGHETTANALAWSFSLLGRHPEALARAQAEADAFGPEGPTSYEPERLAYTTRVFREALRLYPPVVLLPRRTLEPVEIAGVALPERTIVFVNPYGLHMSADVWPEPDRFDPDRFLPEREATRHKSAWLPFGVGPRVCIGNHFAMMEGPLVLATLLRRARFELPTQPIEADAFATLRPKGGVPAVVHHRERERRSTSPEAR